MSIVSKFTDCLWSFDLMLCLRRSYVGHSKRREIKKSLIVSSFSGHVWQFPQLYLKQVSIMMTSSKPEFGNEYLLLPREKVPGHYLFLYLVVMTARGAKPTSVPIVFYSPGDKPLWVLDSCWDLAVYLSFGCRILCQKVGFLVPRDTHVSRYPCKSLELYTDA